MCRASEAVQARRLAADAFLEAVSLPYSSALRVAFPVHRTPDDMLSLVARLGRK